MSDYNDEEFDDDNQAFNDSENVNDLLDQDEEEK